MHDVMVQVHVGMHCGLGIAMLGYIYIEEREIIY